MNRDLWEHMRFAYEWIREYAPVDCSPKELARRLTAAGLSVERIAKESGEHLLELDITTNRPDCMNLYGICREAAALSGTRLRRVRPRLRETGPPIATRAQVEHAAGGVDAKASEKLRATMSDNRGESGLFSFGGTIDEIKARCLDETHLPAPESPHG